MCCVLCVRGGGEKGEEQLCCMAPPLPALLPHTRAETPPPLPAPLYCLPYRLQEELRQERARTPQAVYCLGPDVAHPGTFYLGHIHQTTPRREYFMVTADGFYFRKKVCERWGACGDVGLEGPEPKCACLHRCCREPACWGCTAQD